MRWLITTLVAVCISVMPMAASAQTVEQPITVRQVAAGFTSAGYQVEAPIEWPWLQPEVSTLVVRDTATGRVLTVFVFPDASSAGLFRGVMAAHLQTDSSDPYLLDGYGPSAWTANVGVVESTEVHLADLARTETAQRTGMYATADEPADLHTPNIPVDADFQQALRDSAVNL